MDTFVPLLEGNAAHAEAFESRFDHLQEAQHPEAVTVCCADSRVLQDHIWSNDEPGRVFTCANIGNRVTQQTNTGPVVSGDVLYPIKYTDTNTAIVVGHTGCGAVTATYAALTGELPEPSGIEHCLDLLKPPLQPGVEALADGLDDKAAINRLVEYNVDRQVSALCASDAVPDDVTVAGAVYDFQDIYDGRRGEVHVINIDDERDVDRLREIHPRIDDRIRRLWEY